MWTKTINRRIGFHTLTFRLVLAFLLTSVAGMVLASIIIRQLITRDFSDYVLQQQRETFINEVTSYYEANGSLKGIDQTLVQVSALPPNYSDQSSASPAFPTPQPGSLSQARSPRQPGPPPAQFGLVDANGIVYIGFRNYAMGDQARAEDYAGGTSISSGGQVIAIAITTGPAAERSRAEQQYLARTDLALVIAVAVMIGVALVLGIVLARVITRPVREMTAAAGRIAAGELEQKVPVRSQDELGTLAEAFNHMSLSLARATQLRRQMTADIAHDLRTPLTVISGYVEALRDQTLKPTPQRFSVVFDEIQLLRHLVDDLHTLSLADAGELRLTRQAVSPAVLLSRVAGTYQHAAERGDIKLQVEVDEGLPDIQVDVEHMIRVLSNLVTNALRHTPAGGQVRLIAHATPIEVQLSVTDSGEGISPEHLPFIFERFYRVDSSRQDATGGTGLGLAIVKSLVELHNGTITADSKPGQGTSITIGLPRE